MMPMPGTLLGGRYRLRRAIGEGGMGTVFEAWQEDLRRTVAVKVIGMKPDPESLARFQREARAAAGLGNPHIVQILDFQAPPNEPPFLVMELLAGTSLSDVLRTGGPMAPARIARVARQVLDALGAAHQVGIIHRDIKPANVFVVPSATLGEIAKVLDFGVAKLSDATTSSSGHGSLIGTLAYMAPEQAAGEAIDPRCDIYAVAATMYVACTLRKPYEGDTATALLRAILANDRPPLQALRPDLDPTFVAIVERGMAYRRDDRFSTAYAMAEALDAWLGGRAALTPAPGPMVAVSAPPPAGPGVLGVPTPGHVASATPGSINPPSRTASTWQGPPTGAPAPKSGVGVAVVVGAVVATVLVGGGAVAAILLQRSATNAPPVPSASASTAPATPSAAPPSPSSAPSASGAALASAKAPSLASAKVQPRPSSTPASNLIPVIARNLGKACGKDGDCESRMLECASKKCACVLPNAICNGDCTMLTVDSHCGACNHHCPAGEMCMGPIGDRNPSHWHCVRPDN